MPHSTPLGQPLPQQSDNQHLVGALPMQDVQHKIRAEDCSMKLHSDRDWACAYLYDARGVFHPVLRVELLKYLVK